MDKINFENLPSTSTPLNATNMNKIQSNTEDVFNGNENMGNIVVSNISTKNFFIPTLVNNNVAIAANNCTAGLSGKNIKLTANGSDIYWGQVTAQGMDYSDYRGTLYDVTGAEKISFKLSNSNFTQNYLTAFDSNKVSLGFTRITSSQGTFTLPSGTKYITFRIGISGATSGTTYSTTVQLAKEDTVSNYSPYLDFQNEKSFDFSSIVSFAETPVNVMFREKNGLVTITYQGENKAHASGTVLFTLPEGYRPLTEIWTPANKNGNAYGEVCITPAGRCSVQILSNYTVEGRIYFTVSYFTR